MNMQEIHTFLYNELVKNIIEQSREMRAETFLKPFSKSEETMLIFKYKQSILDSVDKIIEAFSKEGNLQEMLKNPFANEYAIQDYLSSEIDKEIYRK